MYKYPEEVTFHPWVGSHYEDSDNRFGFRLLVLGESHYNDAMNENDQDPEWIEYRNSHGGEHVFTQFVVRKWGQNRRASFFTIIAKVLSGSAEWIDDDARSEILEHVAFYNYVSRHVPWYQDDDRPKRPTSEQWRGSKAPFETVLQSLKPDAVLMLGKELSDCVVNQHNHGNLRMYHAYQHENINFLGIYHPSSRRFFKYDKAIQAFNELIKLTESR